MSLYLIGELANAERELRRLCSLEPTSPRGPLFLVLLYENQERWSEALAKARDLVRIDPANATYQQLLRRLEAQP
jgi:hypothetical protein